MGYNKNYCSTPLIKMRPKALKGVIPTNSVALSFRLHKNEYEAMQAWQEKLKVTESELLSMLIRYLTKKDITWKLPEGAYGSEEEIVIRKPTLSPRDYQILTEFSKARNIHLVIAIRSAITTIILSRPVGKPQSELARAA